jgi:CubicO group peptidase (beta-lactamase class C family)
MALNPRLLLLTALLAPLLSAAGLPAGKPEDAGMSTERLQRIHQMIQRHIDAKEISGAVTLVARRGHVVHFEAHGLMDLESQKPMVKDAIFRLASMSKPVTAVAVMMLVEEGKIRLTDRVSQFIPEFKDTKVAMPRSAAGASAVPAGTPAPIYTVPADREITIRDLLTHTSGLMSSGIAQAEANRLVRRAPDDTLATYIPKLGQVPLDFQPGSQWAYSGGAGPEVLSRIVEIVSGQPYDEYLRTRLYEPLGMKDTFFYPPDDRRSRIPTLYTRFTLQKAPNQDGLSNKVYFSGAAGLMSTAEDYLQFAEMLLNGGILNGKRLLGSRTVELMSSNQVGDMFNGKLGRPAHGMGFGFLMQIVEDPVAAGLRVAKGGFGWDGVYGTQMWIQPKEQMVTIIMLQEQVVQVQRDFENAVMQAIID